MQNSDQSPLRTEYSWLFPHTDAKAAKLLILNQHHQTRMLWKFTRENNATPKYICVFSVISRKKVVEKNSHLFGSAPPKEKLLKSGSKCYSKLQAFDPRGYKSALPCHPAAPRPQRRGLPDRCCTLHKAAACVS